MSLLVPNLSISGFRSFRNLDIGPFGRVNLITGKNNSGKSTLLEAIRILVTEGSPTTFFSILNYREEIDYGSEESIATIQPEDIDAFCNFFSGFPILPKSVKPFKIQVIGETALAKTTLSLNLSWYKDEPSGNPALQRSIRVNPDLFGEVPGFPALDILFDQNRERLIPCNGFIQYRRNPLEYGEGASVGCIFLDPFISKSTKQLGFFWDRIALTDAEKEVVNALHLLSPDIQAISMIGSEGGARSRTAIARSSQYDHPVPLRSFGDGVNRLFGLILSMVNAKGGVFLVDEIENGFHYSILPDVWRVIFRVAADLDIQVFATTHSWDCIDAFQKAASEHPAEGVLTRLTVKDDRVIPTIFRENDLEIITRNRIEVR